ncbi:MAG TPA: hypothetical protein VK828_10045 [Terriglobales bacterium]|nr:hypothetical protein [Terriglobales bacterium]
MAALSNPTRMYAAAIAAFSWLTSPLAIVTALSLVVGLVMVVLFGYTSDQKAIGIAKDQLKAHLLAVRLYRDQIPVVMGSYGKILRGTGRYLKLAFEPLLYVIVPITLLMVEVDRYLGQTPIAVNAPFLLTVHFDGHKGGIANIGNEDTNTSDALSNATLELPPEISTTAPPVHIVAENEVVWRLAGAKDGNYTLKISGNGPSVGKAVCIGGVLPRISTVRLRGKFWERMFSSAEPAIPQDSSIESISINYPDRDISVAGYAMNWIWMFFILSMVAGFVFKELLGIQI